MDDWCIICISYISLQFQVWSCTSAIENLYATWIATYSIFIPSRWTDTNVPYLITFFFLAHAAFNPLSLPSLESFHFIPFCERARARVCVCLFYLFLSLSIAIQSIFRPSYMAIGANAEYRVVARVKGLRKQATWEIWDLKYGISERNIE